MATTRQERTTLRRSLSVWQAVGISLADGSSDGSAEAASSSTVGP